MNTRTAYLSALGSMGRRHLIGLVRSGYTVYANDINPDAYETALIGLDAAGLPRASLHFAAKTPVNVDVAIFAETANARYHNLSTFLASSRPNSILLEKPISSSPAELDLFATLLDSCNLLDVTYVNFARRSWPHIQFLRSICRRVSNFSVSVMGGAVGFGCNGIHLIDTYLFLVNVHPSVGFSRISSTPVLSGRGPDFFDFGGEFILYTPNSHFYASLSSHSSAPVVMTVQGTDFTATADYGSKTLSYSPRNPNSDAPLYLYGADYDCQDIIPFAITPLDQITYDWSKQNLSLPSFTDSLTAHKLLFEILSSGGALPPYYFT